MNRTYSELSSLKTFEERFNYLKLGGKEIFGNDRILNQIFYRSKEWRRVRREIIIRDEGFDMGLYPFEIVGRIIVHHMNPLTVEDLLNKNYDKLFGEENLISVSIDTHEAIGYGDGSLLPRGLVVRKPGDTKLW